jgi:hypothetical protein
MEKYMLKDASTDLMDQLTGWNHQVPAGEG